MRINFKKTITYAYHQKRVIKKFAWLPVFCERRINEKSLLFLEYYICHQNNSPSPTKRSDATVVATLGLVAQLVIMLPFYLYFHNFYLLILTLPLHTYLSLACLTTKFDWSNLQKLTLEYAPDTDLKKKFPEFFNKEFTNKFDKIINE